MSDLHGEFEKGDFDSEYDDVINQINYNDYRFNPDDDDGLDNRNEGELYRLGLLNVDDDEFLKCLSSDELSYTELNHSADLQMQKFNELFACSPFKITDDDRTVYHSQPVKTKFDSKSKYESNEECHSQPINEPIKYSKSNSVGTTQSSQSQYSLESDLSYDGGFMTASGKKIFVSDDLLSKARCLLDFD